MKLEKIRLAGFKSFVDPTTVPFPSNLVSVVGPNGCGKSNIIDAVRWVMGESSAKMLRGESMADVIFNGSTGRKPVGTASIELVFDNSDGSAGGEYAKYNQISVKRQVSRDGQSSYFLNSARCRRRDIQDLFLGTGLGPRSYAIIEQGMISRFIEARPEDLRLFLEEAAGISKYKERRRETEGRMRSTRDNLERLNDVRDEVAKQLLHLERQAAAAEKYKQLRAEERRLDAELKALRWQSLEQELAAKDDELRAEDLAIEGDVARQRNLEAAVEETRDAYVEASDRFNSVQGRYYALGAEVARIEQGIRFTRESRARQEAELVRVAGELAETQAHLAADEQALAAADQALAVAEPELQAGEGRLEDATGAVSAAEANLETWEREWDAFNRRAAEPAQLAQVERARINQMEQRLGQDRQRLLRIEEEMGRLDTAGLAAEAEVLAEREQVMQERLDSLAEAREGIAAALAEQEQALRLAAEELNRARSSLQSAVGRRASLVALQEAALRDPEAPLEEWLRARGLADAPRLASFVEVDADWERALEVALAPHLGAVCTDGFPVETEVPGGLTLFDTAVAEPQEDLPTDSLRAVVRCPWPLQGLIGRVRRATDLDEALRARSALGPGACWATPDGTLIGPNWLRTPASNDALGGVLGRAQELKGLEQEIAGLEEAVRALEVDQEQRRDQRAQAEAERDRLAAETAQASKALASLQADLAARRARLDHQNERRAALAGERTELGERADETVAEIEEARQRLHAALEAIETLAAQRDSLAVRREALREEVVQARQAERQTRERVHALKVAIEGHRASREATRRNLERARDLRDQLVERQGELRAGHAELLAPLADQEAALEEQLALRLEVEEALGAARREMDDLDAKVRELEQGRQRVEREVQERQAGAAERRVARQELVVRRRTLEEQLDEGGTRPAEVLAGLEAGAAEPVWQQRLEQISARVQRLGNINLAAIDEFEEQSERKRYLDAQHADITRALETLEQAIRRIDRETRSRFKETYDQVNQGLQQLFPRLFGGGHAYLELTGEDLLETGVSVMARPPGKRNSSIHLLSGGEKALTAVALVFAIFQLNPAPFCMLDEVDAPLDDANVGRFCELVRAMSNQVQFIFITHNKVTMEIADHLLGVTMHEPGVSRLVSVDVDEAARLAAVS
jgi:chromosome segregation protein